MWVCDPRWGPLSQLVLLMLVYTTKSREMFAFIESVDLHVIFTYLMVILQKKKKNRQEMYTKMILNTSSKSMLHSFAFLPMCPCFGF